MDVFNNSLDYKNEDEQPTRFLRRLNQILEGVTENGALKYWVEWKPRLMSIRAAERNKNLRYCLVYIIDRVAVLC